MVKRAFAITALAMLPILVGPTAAAEQAGSKKSVAQEDPGARDDVPAQTSDSGFAYGAIFWAPLVILVVAGCLAYGLTRKVPSRRG